MIFNSRLKTNDALRYSLASEYDLALKVSGIVLSGIKPAADLQKKSTPKGSGQFLWVYSRAIQFSRPHNRPFVKNRDQALHRGSSLRPSRDHRNAGTIRGSQCRTNECVRKGW